MPKFRKLPVVIEAEQFVGAPMDHLGGVVMVRPADGPPYVEIATA